MKPLITAIIPVRKNSVRLKNKNFLPFFKNKSLLEIKIDQLKKIKYINQIVVSSDSMRAKKIATKNKIKFHNRKKYYASSKCSGGNFFKNLAESIEGDYLVYCPCTSPIITNKTYKSFFENFYKFKNKFDSFNTVSELKTFIWKDHKPLNYNLLNAPNSQDLPDNYKSLSFGINIINKKKMIKFKNIVGKKPKFLTLEKFESIDINDKVDFELAKLLYKKYQKRGIL
jgi:CMP-N-acetylneuraminic acid synthetase